MNRLIQAIRRARLHPMPSTVGEAIFRRWFWQAAVVGNALFAVVLTVCIFLPDWPWEQAALVFTGLAIAFWILAGGTTVFILVRPRHTVESLIQAALRRAVHSARTATTSREFEGLPDEAGVFIPGSSRISRALMGIALGWVVSFSLFAIVADGGWRVLWLVCVGLLVLVVISKALAIRPRWLLLTPESISVAGSRATEQVRWDDIEWIEFDQGYDGLAVYRLFPQEGVPTHATHRHPFSLGRRKSIDIEFATLDLDPLLLAIAVEIYRRFPDARAELEGPTAPIRLTDPVKALEGVTLPKHLADFRPESRKR